MDPSCYDILNPLVAAMQAHPWLSAFLMVAVAVGIGEWLTIPAKLSRIATALEKIANRP